MLSRKAKPRRDGEKPQDGWVPSRGIRRNLLQRQRWQRPQVSGKRKCLGGRTFSTCFYFEGRTEKIFLMSRIRHIRERGSKIPGVDTMTPWMRKRFTDCEVLNRGSVPSKGLSRQWVSGKVSGTDAVPVPQSPQGSALLGSVPMVMTTMMVIFLGPHLCIHPQSSKHLHFPISFSHLPYGRAPLQSASHEVSCKAGIQLVGLST